MSVYNVKVSVVALIAADSESAAIAVLLDRLRKAGFEPYDGDEPEAFESEPVPAEWVDNLPSDLTARMSVDLSALRVGDIVLAGAGMRAELRSSFVSDERTPDAVVRWIDADGNGWQHSRVPWSTVRPVTA